MTELEAIANEQFKKLELLNEERIQLANKLSSNLGCTMALLLLLLFLTISMSITCME